MPIRVTRFADVIREVLHLRSAPPKVTRHDKFNLVAWERISDTPRWLPEFALRLASWPPAVVAWSGEDLIGGLERLMEVPSLARASRFLVLAVSEVFGPASLDIDALYPGWDWQ